MLERLDSMQQYSLRIGDEFSKDRSPRDSPDALALTSLDAIQKHTSSYSAQRMSLTISEAFRHAAIILCQYLVPSITLETNPRVQESVCTVLWSLNDGFDASVPSKFDQGSVFLSRTSSLHAMPTRTRTASQQSESSANSQSEGMARVVLLSLFWKLLSVFGKSSTFKSALPLARSKARDEPIFLRGKGY